jgi:predicted amidohydrolase YtcJ
MLDLADVVFRVGRAYGMTADRGTYQAVAVKDGRITAVARSRDELDSFIGPGTAVIDDPELVLYPAFNDTHNHQLLAARDLDYVSLEQARSVDDLPSQQPALTLVGGRPVHDPDGLVGIPRGR